MSAVIAVGLLLCCLFLPVRCMVWDGGFPQFECRISFRDATGQPVEGVALRVETQAGGNCYFYPVTDYVPDDVPVSDKSGVLVFHHVSDFLEFGGKDCASILGIQISSSGGAPKYVCRFFQRGREVHSVWFNEIYQTIDHKYGPSVKRHFVCSDWLMREYLSEIKRGGDEASLRMRLFDCNGDGKLDREEHIAARVSERTMGYFERPEDKLKRREQEVEFAEIELQVTIQRLPENP
jgi:hypothetical protein